MSMYDICTSLKPNPYDNTIVDASQHEYHARYTRSVCASAVGEGPSESR